MKVVAVTATYRRAAELARLLDSLRQSSVPLAAFLACDNADDAETRQVLQQSCRFPVHRLVPGANLGCGGGLRITEEAALLKYPDFTHLCVLDDDVVLQHTTLATLLDAINTQPRAGSACPLAADASGRLNWFPGLQNRRKWDILRHAPTPEHYRNRCGNAPEPFTWATGVAFLVSRPIIEAAGLHRGDFWIRGEDLDFSLRMTATAPGLLVPAAQIMHLPPGGGQVVNNFPERMKHAAMIQNSAYLAAHTSHGRALVRHLPGNVWRHLRRFKAPLDVLKAIWHGALCGRPAGHSAGDVFRRRLAQFKR